MKLRFWGILLAISLISLNAKIGFTQEKSAAPTQENELDTQWLWGEVKSLDIANNEIVINYFDYDTDSEKEIKINTDNKTVYDNINSLNDIKLNDAISVDYVISPDGKYIAKNISIEKTEEISLSSASSMPPAAP
jgi:hypothetical protein